MTFDMSAFGTVITTRQRQGKRDLCFRESRQHRSPFPGNGISRGRDYGAETVRLIQPIVSKDKVPARTEIRLTAMSTTTAFLHRSRMIPYGTAMLRFEPADQGSGNAQATEVSGLRFCLVMPIPVVRPIVGI